MSIPRRSLLLSAVPAYLAAQVPQGKSIWSDLPLWMALADVPGVAAALIENGRVAEVRAFGVRSVLGTGGVDANTLFEAASLSKPVFATAVLRLAKEKRLDLDQPLDDIVQLSSDPRAKLITARHVLSHSTGLQNWRNPYKGQFEFAFTPGEKFSYSGEGYFYLQRVVEAITEAPFARYMRETVLEPMGMTRSGFVWEPDANMALPHDYRGRPMGQPKENARRRISQLEKQWNKPAENWFVQDQEKSADRGNGPGLPNNFPMNAAATLMTTAADYAKFLVHTFSLDQLRQPQTRINGDLSWGLGCGIDTSAGVPWHWHWGDNGGYKNWFIANAQERRGIVIFTNADGGPKVYSRLVRAAMGRDFSSLLWA